MTRPNVIVIVADDLGFSDIGAFGGEIETPNLDRLAARGTRMSSFYVTPRCSPSRAALLTGRQPHTVGIGILTSDDRPDGYRGALSTEAPTLAERLKAEGYATALAGKWHLSSNIERPDATWPTRRGFDEFYGFLPGCGSYYQPRLQRGDQLVEPREYARDDYYLTDDISDFAVDFVQRAGQGDRPFFLYLAHSAPHWPLHAPADGVAKYRDRYAAGWDAIRAQRFTRQAELGLALTRELPPRDAEVGPWDAAPDHEWEVERMAVYAAQVEIMDRGIGRLLDELDRQGIADDTLITFSSDNGACAEPMPDPDDWGIPETICPPFTRDGRRVRRGDLPGVMPGAEDTYSSYGRAWANASNTPFRLYKRWVHEGGISSAFIASWPGGGVIADRLLDEPAHIVDIVPTVIDAVSGSTTDTPGRSLLRTWRGLEIEDDVTLFWEHIGNAAIRRGPWKLVREALGPWELYDIPSDRGETRDLADEHPEVVTELERAWDEWAEANDVIPWQDVLDDYERRGRLGQARG